MTTLTVTVKNRTSGTTTGVEGVYQLPNSSPAKLARKDGSTVFPNRGSLTQAAQRLANTLGWQYEISDVQKKAAKKSVKPTTKAKAKTAAVTASSNPKNTSCTKLPCGKSS